MTIDGLRMIFRLPVDDGKTGPTDFLKVGLTVDGRKGICRLPGVGGGATLGVGFAVGLTVEGSCCKLLVGAETAPDVVFGAGFIFEKNEGGSRRRTPGRLNNSCVGFGVRLMIERFKGICRLPVVGDTFWL